jgi:hypothetical protein
MIFCRCQSTFCCQSVVISCRCQHTAVTRGMAEVLVHREQPIVKQLWELMGRQMEACTACVDAFQDARVCPQLAVVR